ncbi:hypothetical protein PPL_02024 [Heterostelium album PN500]|uniref:Uncharacterized protein n=1 Tax=Heterostelium pallidum (strain ATCC 26659 / Pp 5 / PN500) TaxID=670386 RepID=D3B154_HETP5|nr:hypothetical protein PPL_02024 [Heterostelium album PN500]EFA85028.1 hypothetical protein PPL_02024 [Heterostelium album PN500]|eukprot:XP_020437138.1 hypothetical protein PPL_02024 [Heterostelium album PN500]
MTRDTERVFISDFQRIIQRHIMYQQSSTSYRTLSKKEKAKKDKHKANKVFAFGIGLALGKVLISRIFKLLNFPAEF